MLVVATSGAFAQTIRCEQRTDGDRKGVAAVLSIGQDGAGETRIERFFKSTSGVGLGIIENAYELGDSVVLHSRDQKDLSISYRFDFDRSLLGSVFQGEPIRATITYSVGGSFSFDLLCSSHD